LQRDVQLPHDDALRVSRDDYYQQHEPSLWHVHAWSTAGAVVARGLLLLKTAHARSVLANVERHALKVEHCCHDRGVNLAQPLVLRGVTSERRAPRLFCFLNCGHCGPRSVSSSRRLYRKKPAK
jgi:hypothetical protein